MPARIRVELSYAARTPWVPTRGQFQRWLDALRLRKGGIAVVSISVVGAVRSRSLNRRYRGRDKATNVLSFAGAGRLPNRDWELGELVICAPVVAAEARSQGKSFDAHWAHMTIHGALHLLGFDHEAAAQAARMESMEVQILDRLGFSNPYL
jgi:probable rRNA maturation factor